MHKQVAVSNLTAARITFRAINPGPEMDELIGSILAKGVLQNLLCYGGGAASRSGAKGDTAKVEVYGGRRRLHALRELLKSGEIKPSYPVNCEIFSTREEAEEAAVIENAQRQDPHPVETWRAYSRVAAKKSPEEAARIFFAGDEKKMLRALALGRVDEQILDDCLAGKIGVDAARAYARLPKRDAQAKLYKALKKTGQHGSEAAIAKAVDDQRIPVGRNIFELNGSGLEVSADLFDDKHRFFLDNAAFFDAQRDAAQALADRLRGDGWGEVDVHENATMLTIPKGAEQVTDKLARTKRGNGGARIDIRADGSVIATYWLKPEAAKKNPAKKPGKGKAAAQAGGARGVGGEGGDDSESVERAGLAGGDARDGDQESGVEYPKAVQMDLYRVKTLMLQQALARNPRHALAYLVFSLLTMGVRLNAQHSAADSWRFIEEPESAKSPLCDAIQTAGDKLRTDLMTLLEGGDPEAALALDDAERAALLAALCELTVEALLGILAGLMAERIGYFDGNHLPERGGILDALGHLMAIDPCRLWRPSMEFLSKLPKPVVREIAAIFGEEFVQHHRREGRDELAKSLHARFTLDQSAETNPVTASIKVTWVPEILAFNPPAAPPANPRRSGPEDE